MILSFQGYAETFSQTPFRILWIARPAACGNLGFVWHCNCKNTDRKDFQGVRKTRIHHIEAVPKQFFCKAAGSETQSSLSRQPVEQDCAKEKPE